MADQNLPSPASRLVDDGGRPDVVWYQRLQLMWNAFNALTATQASDKASLQSSVAAIDVLTTRGDLLVRGASAYQRLGVGAAGTRLTSDGTDAAWVSGGIETIVDTTSFPADVSVDITDIPASYSYLALHIAGASSDTATRAVMVQASTDNGGTFDSTAANYPGYYAQATPTFTNNGLASLMGGGTVAAAAATTVSLKLFAYQGGSFPVAEASITGGGTNYTSSVHYIGSTSAINALRILWNGSGSFDAGSYALFGVK